MVAAGKTEATRTSQERRQDLPQTYTGIITRPMPVTERWEGPSLTCMMRARGSIAAVDRESESVRLRWCMVLARYGPSDLPKSRLFLGSGIACV